MANSMTLLGLPGKLFNLYVTNDPVEVTQAERHSFSTTLEGRVKAQSRPLAKRQWELKAGLIRPEEQSILFDFADGAWGPGPFNFVPPDGIDNNILTPGESTCSIPNIAFAYVDMGGPWELSSGVWAPQSYVNKNYPSARLPLSARDVPCVPGRTMTASAWVQGAGASVGIQYFDADGNFLSEKPGARAGALTAVTRLSCTDTVPAKAVTCAVVAFSASRATRPALTWTEEMNPWSQGLGCRKAVVLAPTRSMLQVDYNGITSSNLSFTVKEVG